jgi:hypothetical protein
MIEVRHSPRRSPASYPRSPHPFPAPPYPVHAGAGRRSRRAPRTSRSGSWTWAGSRRRWRRGSRSRCARPRPASRCAGCVTVAALPVLHGVGLRHLLVYVFVKCSSCLQPAASSAACHLFCLCTVFINWRLSRSPTQVGFDASPFAVARAVAVAEMLRRGAPDDHVLQASCAAP